ncbi:MAG: LLM class flavin-dependent oxidoreductase [Actinomycetota bacterium]|nr:LLM class flavin-dependent oxidoreductase [Actinomycetota bacterium]MEC9059747.1 LLM class flavin-dependent oxidoreductase [Actinomycetota bacterium]
MKTTERQIVLVGFLQAQNCTTIPAAWRHPEARHDVTNVGFYQDIAKILERGFFDLGFFDDRLAMPDMYGGDHRHTVEHGIRCVKLDAVTVLTTMGMATEKLGLGATYSTTYFPPFHIARVFSTLDHMTGGRAAWNVVTSVNDNEARNMGLPQAPAHDVRYDRADEFMEVVHGHWDTWEADAVIADRTTGLYAQGDKVHRLDHKGDHYSSRGPFTVPRTPQGHPVIIQAGQSGRGIEFAARWGELLFMSNPTLSRASENYAQVKTAVEAAGRDPSQVKIANLTFPVVGRTMSEAEDRRAAYDLLPNLIDDLSLLSEGLNFDFSEKELDDPLSAEDVAAMTGIQGIRNQVIEVTGKDTPTLRDFVNVSGRGRLAHPVVGGPTELADYFEEWFTTPACDGFVIAGTHMPGAFQDFVDLVVPELQRRGLFRTQYSGNTLRDHLGLTQPIPGAWRR